MAFSSESSNQGQPLSVGNIVSTGLKLYSSHFQQFFGVAALATLWVLLPFAALIPIVAFFSIVQNYYALLGLLIPAWIVLLVYCIAKYLAGSAAVARLAYGQLTNQPETTQQAKRFTQSRMWGFWLIGLILSLIYGGIGFIAYIVLGIVAVVFFLLVGGLGGMATVDSPVPAPTMADPLVIALVLLVSVVLISALVLLITWFSARFSIAEMPLTVELESTPARSIERSWNLTQKNAWRIVLILSVTFLITLPLQVFVQIISGILQVFIIAATPTDVGSAVAQAVSVLASYAIGFLLGVFVLPLWQSIKAVIYYDLRSRREGMGLALRDRS